MINMKQVSQLQLGSIKKLNVTSVQYLYEASLTTADKEFKNYNEYSPERY